ncbi:MAG: hypothetical protein KC731_14980 [Myxococcales bacterium]|nr:hypothetical protein [Myxococcales bacterium]
MPEPEARPAEEGSPPTYEGLNLGCLTALLLTAVLVSAIPYVGGVATFVLGLWIRRSGHNTRRMLAAHRRRAPPDSPHAVVLGDSATLLGRVVGPAAEKTPLGHAAVVANLWLDDEIIDSLEDAAPTWTKQLGDELVIEARGARIVAKGAMDILSHKVETTSQTNGHPPDHAPLDADERAALTKRCDEYGERWLEPDMEVLVQGLVHQVEDGHAPAQQGYRDEGRIRTIELRPPGDAPIRVSTYTPRQLAEANHQARAETLGGTVMMVIGAVALALWISFAG